METPKNEKTRRDFLKIAGITAAAIATTRVTNLFNLMGSSAWAKAPAKPAADDPLPAGMQPVPETDAVAQAIGYKPDIKDLDYTRFARRKEKSAQDQFCKNCALYTPVNPSWGKCQMLASGVVRSKGWCGSWSKKV